MKRREMLDVARRELAHIPDWPRSQRMLRATFWNLRLNSLGRKSELPDDPLAVLRRAMELVAADEPGVELEYDAAFFEGAARP